MNVPSTDSCGCADCPGNDCRCGCQVEVAPSPALGAGQACACGPNCGCGAAERGCPCSTLRS